LLSATDRKLMRMYVMFVVVIVLTAGLLFVTDRSLKAIRRGRRRRDAAIRLVAAARRAKQEYTQVRHEEDVSTALTVVLPAIPAVSDRGARKVA
jgi:hypothetical protein